MLYGVIDIGSNTIRFMIYRIENGELYPVLNNKYAAGLASYITPRGKMGKDGIERVTAILCELKAVTEQVALDEVFPFGTAPLRNISNTAEVLRYIKAKSGFDVRVLSGEEEAQFDYYGALHSTAINTGLLVDVGGGSTELVCVHKGKATSAVSIPVGSLNLYTRFVEGILPSRREIRHIEEEVGKEIQNIRDKIPGKSAWQLCTVGGTARAALKVYNALNEKKQNTVYDTEFYDDFISQIEAGPGKLTRRILKIAPERIHTLTPGVAILQAVSKTFDCRTVVTTPYGVREGFLYDMLRRQGVLK